MRHLRRRRVCIILATVCTPSWSDYWPGLRRDLWLYPVMHESLPRTIGALVGIAVVALAAESRSFSTRSDPELRDRLHRLSDPPVTRLSETVRLLYDRAAIKKAFTSDHCSVVPDYDHAACCVRHDWLYWQGGDRRARKMADRAFYRCLRATTKRRLAFRRWLGIRFGGIGILPVPWRWGYGWRWPRSGPPTSDKSKFTTENQREVYEAILKNAEEADRKARETD